MAASVKKLPHNSAESDSASHDSTKKSAHEVFDSNMDFSTSKFRTPPPKPPRRRHSDQSSGSHTGIFPFSRRKHVDGSQSYNKNDSTPKLSNNKSGCDSLPANWNSDFHVNEDVHGTNLFKMTNMTPSLDDVFSEKTPTPGLLTDKCNTSLMDNVFPHEDNTFTSLQQTNSSSEQYLKLKSSSNNAFQLLGENNSVILSRSNVNNITSDNDVKGTQKDVHRRHHSDPVPFELDQILKNNVFLKSHLESSSSAENASVDKYNNCPESTTISKETQCLYEELKTLKQVNARLWEHLCSVQAAVDNFANSPNEDQSLSISGLLSDLYYAQKAKDLAMEERLRVALEDRDLALTELEEMVNAVARGFEDSDSVCSEDGIAEKEIKDLLHEIEVTQNPAKLLQQQRLLLSHLYRSKEVKQGQLSHELKLCRAERDNAVEKVKQLEEEISRVTHSNGIRHLDVKHWESSLLDILCQVIDQRDSKEIQNNSLQEKKHHMEHGLQGLEKSSSEMQHTNSDYESFQKHEVIFTHPSDTKATCKCNEQPSLENKTCLQISVDASSEAMDLLKDQVCDLTKMLETEKKKRETVEENCLRLEKLVSVLRKKLNGQRVGVPV